MPTHQTVECFVELVETGKGTDALDRFYAENASMQENQSLPRIGKPALLAYETAAQSSVSGMTAQCIRPILIEGDTVVLRWIFDYVDSQGRAVHFEELERALMSDRRGVVLAANETVCDRKLS